tara:strand:- start:2618 stop:2875 length:258 start_codon:yes stop_codon:yes gene_type:complete
MADRLTADATRALIERVAKDLPNVRIAELTGIDRANTVTEWKSAGMPTNLAALLVLRLMDEKRREQAALARSLADLENVRQKFKL